MGKRGGQEEEGPGQEGEGRQGRQACGRMRIVWTVMNDAFKPVGIFEYSQKEAAEARAAELTAKGKGTHFVQKTKEPMPDNAPGLGAADPSAGARAARGAAKQAAAAVEDEEETEEEDEESEEVGRRARRGRMTGLVRTVRSEGDGRTKIRTSDLTLIRGAL